MQGQEAQNLRKKVFWTAVAWYHPPAYVSDSFHWSGDFEFVFISSYYYHSLILSFSLVILFCRGRKVEPLQKDTLDGGGVIPSVR